MTEREFYERCRQQGAVVKNKVVYAAGRGLDLRRLTLPENVSVFASGDLRLLPTLTLSENVTLVAGRDLYLISKPLLPQRATFIAGNNLYLDGVVTVPDGIVFCAGRGVRSSTLTGPELLRVNGYVMCILCDVDVIGDYRVWSALYLGNNRRCYVSRRGECVAAGRTAQEAAENCHVAFLSRTAKKT